VPLPLQSSKREGRKKKSQGETSIPRTEKKGKGEGGPLHLNIFERKRPTPVPHQDRGKNKGGSIIGGGEGGGVGGGGGGGGGVGWGGGGGLGGGGRGGGLGGR